MTTWIRERTDVTIERQIVTGMITSTRVLRHLSLAWKPRYFTVPFSAQVARWCMEHLAAYDEAPGRYIQDIYEHHRRNGLDQEMSALIGQFLSSISDEYQSRGNPEYLLDSATKYFQERALNLLVEDVQANLGRGNLLAAEEAVARHSAPGQGISLGYEPLRDMNLIRDAFEGDDELFRLDGDLGAMLGPFVREDVWGLVGAYKVGKTHMCFHIQDQALYAGLNVARFSFEMNRRKETRRFIQSVCAMPLKEPKGGRLWVPVWDCQANQDGTCNHQGRTGDVALFREGGKKPPFDHGPAGYRPCATCRGGPRWRMESWVEERPVDLLTWREAWRKATAIADHIMGARFRFQYWPMRSAGVPEIKSTLQVWEHMEGFVPDLIVIDRPDIMDFHGREERHAIIANRREVVALAQQYHALVVFPIQAGSKAAIERKTKKQSDVAESVEVLGDVDSMMVLDQTEEEYEAMRARVRTTVQRDDRRGSQVAILQALDLGQAVIDSTFLGRIK